MYSFEFKLLRRDDYALVSSWLTTPHVQRWWNHDPSFAAIEEDYGGCVDGTEPAEAFIAHYGGAPAGLIQRYRVGAYPQYMDELGRILHVPANATSIDYLVGPTDVLGKGIGTAMIAAFVARTWMEYADTPAIVVPIQASNRASWRSLERVGFRRVAEGEMEPDNPIDSRAHYIYQLDRK